MTETLKFIKCNLNEMLTEYRILIIGLWNLFLQNEKGIEMLTVLAQDSCAQV